MTRTLTVAATALVAMLALALPAVAATPTYKGTVGPGFTIKMATKPTKAGKIKLVVSDKSSQHNFHLTGGDQVQRIPRVILEQDDAAFWVASLPHQLGEGHELSFGQTGKQGYLP